MSKSREATACPGAPAAFPRWQEVTPLPAARERGIAGGDGAGGFPGGRGYLVVYSL